MLDIAKLERRLAKIQDEIDKAKESEAQASAQVAVLETAIGALGDPKELREQKDSLKAQMKSGREELGDLKVRYLIIFLRAVSLTEWQ